jgi:serine/threonine protein kinase
MDTYAMGNTIYALLTGLWPFYQYGPDDSKIIQKKLIDNSEKPFVDPRYRTRSFIEAELVKIMEQCWEWDLVNRLPIFDVVRQLQELKAEAKAKGRLLTS